MEKVDWDLIERQVSSDRHRLEKMRSMNKETLIEYYYEKITPHRIEGFLLGAFSLLIVFGIATGLQHILTNCGCV